MNQVSAPAAGGSSRRLAGTLAMMLAVSVLLVSAGTPAAARSVPVDDPTESPTPPRDPTTEMYLDDQIAPGINRGTSGFGTATAIVPAGYRVTYLVRTDPVHAGKTLIIWTRSKGGAWTHLATRAIAEDGTVHFYARVQHWTAFRATYPGGDGIQPLAARGKIAWVASTPFTIEVFPAERPAEGRPAVGRQLYVFLVRLHDSSGCSRFVRLSATAPGARVFIERRWLGCGGVAEVTVVPPSVNEETTLRVVILATRAGVTTAVVRTILVRPGKGPEAAQAMRYLRLFLPWLAAKHPELGITPATVWSETPVRNLLVVTHYMFVSDKWEIVLSWHNMIPPYDWTRIELRHRWTEAWPSRAFEISSVAAHNSPHQIAPPEVVTR